MKAEILSIGSELTSGQNLDTNAQWLSRELAAIGIEVRFHTTVADDLQDNLNAFHAALARAELVLVTGGLGPTLDDLTREVVAQVAGVPLVLDEESLRAIETMFAQRKRPMPDRNRVQALLPQGALAIPNPHGTAPGIWLELGERLMVCMPGVPAEMFPMFTDWVRPRLRDRFATGRVIVHRVIRCFGAGESAIEQRLGNLIRRGRMPEVGITASEATISLRITATGTSAAEAWAATEPDAQFIKDQLGELVFGEGDVQLQQVVVQLLLETGLTLSTAESCTGGLLGHLLTEVSGVSEKYLGGVVSYSNAAKQQLLGVPEPLLATHGAVSPEVAEHMATGCRRRFGSDLAVGITGIAGPGGGTPTKPVGLVYVALAHANGVEVAQTNWLADRSAVKLRSAKAALNLLRLHLLRSRSR